MAGCVRWWSNLKNESKGSDLKIDRKLMNYFLQWTWLCNISKGSWKSTSVLLLLEGDVSFPWCSCGLGRPWGISYSLFPHVQGLGRNAVRFSKLQSLEWKQHKAMAGWDFHFSLFPTGVCFSMWSCFSFRLWQGEDISSWLLASIGGIEKMTQNAGWKRGGIESWKEELGIFKTGTRTIRDWYRERQNNYSKRSKY